MNWGKMEKFKFKKHYGQNFISDKNLLKAIVLDSGLTNQDNVLEIGPGKGALSREIVEVAKKLVCIEIDTSLKPFLDEVLKSKNNVKVIYNDVMKIDTSIIESEFDGKYKIIANLPYYITTPIIFKFLENSNNIQSITIMVQKEVAERICSNNIDPNYGVLSIMCNHYANCEIKRIVKRNMFYPVPSVDSALVNLHIKENIDKNFSKKMLKLVQISFSMRRKTLVNNLIQGLKISREKAEKLVQIIDKKPTVRAEELTVADFERFTEILIKDKDIVF